MRKEGISFVDYSDEIDNILCPFCDKVGIKVKLLPHFYDVHGRDLIEPDNFMQCTINGNHLIPIYETKLELDYGPVVDMVDNPFDSGTEIKSVEHRKKKKRVPRNQKHKVDLDMATEHGNINIVYDSTGNY